MYRNKATQIIYRYVHVRLSSKTYSNRCDRDGRFSAGRNPRRCTRYNDSSQEIISINTLTAAFHRVRWISVLEFGILMRQIRIKKSQLTRYVNAYETISHCTYLPIYKFSQYAHKEKKKEKEKKEKLLTKSYVPIMLDWKYLNDYLIALCLFASYLFCPSAFLIQTFSLVKSYLHNMAVRSNGIRYFLWLIRYCN